jgi:alkaline phosphatase
MPFCKATSAIPGLLLAGLLGTACSHVEVIDARPVKPRNIILMVGDGMGYAHVKAYRYFADDPAVPGIASLSFEQYLVGSVATEAITLNCQEDDESQCVQDPYGITDSASSASAYATGLDTLVGRLGMSVDNLRQENISEKARRQGIAVGIVSTSQVTHATPAAFYAHVGDRSEGNGIADQLFDNQWQGQPLPQVILGGGLQMLQREDRDITADFVAAGYTLVTDKSALQQASSTRLLGLFAPIGLPRAWDRPATTPSLADMTGAALKSLEQNAQGFFLMVEGSQIDWAAHSNDVVGVVSEMQDFHAAIDVALAYAAGRTDTLVVITADHETGGLSMGRDDEYFWNPRPMQNLKRTPAAITEEFLAGDQPLSVVAAPHLPFALTEEEREKLDVAKVETPPYPEYGVDGTQAYTLLSLLFDHHTQTAWTSMGHTGVDVPVYATGPGSEKLHGVIQNEVLGQLLQSLLLSE